ncbi:hypothetical protein MMC18_001946 [Xylographa bjoerkii]|nr:hypothetical protein [Xylographa bjoerkii]
MLNFKPLLKSGQFSDLTIKCNGTERRVHRVVICVQSPVFTVMCTGAFKEATSGVIDLSDHDIRALDLLLDYLYTGDYDEHKAINSAVNADCESINKAGTDTTITDAAFFKQPTDESTISEIAEPTVHVSVPLQATNATMYAIGERYDIAALKDLAEHKFAAHEFTKWSDQLPEVIELVYTTTPDSDRRLRDITRNTFGPYASSLIQDQAIVDVVLRVPTVGLDLCRGCTVHMESLLRKVQDEKAEAVEEARVKTSEAMFQQSLCSAAHLKLDDLRNKINSVSSCSRCYAHFFLNIDPIIPAADTPVGVSCSKCKSAV